MRTPVRLLVFAFVLVAFAGCIGGDDGTSPEGGDDTPDSADTVETTADTGSVKGQIFGADNLEPLAGALVNLVGTSGGDGYETKVARNGDYVINKVAPGRYSVIIFAAGYHQGVKAVDVVADNVHTVNFQLEPLPSDEPYDTWEPITGILSSSVIWWAEVNGECLVIQEPTLVKSCGGYAFFVSPDDNQEIKVNVTDDVKTVMVELVWDPTGPLGEYLQMDLLSPETPRSNGDSGGVTDLNYPGYFKSTDFESPISYRVDEEHWLEHGYNYTGLWAARVFASYGMLGTYELLGVDAGAAYEQPFTYYVSVFHKEPAPEGHSGIPDL